MASFRRATHAVSSATFIAPVRPAYAAGLRASLATVLPLAVGQLAGNPVAATWMSLGGFSASLSDRGGSYRTRAYTMAAILAGAGVTTILGTLASGHVVAALAVTFAVAFSASLLRVWGNPGVSVSGAALSAYVVALAIAPSPGDWYHRPLFLGLGALWAMCLALILWPLRPYRPAREAVAACYRALAVYIGDVVTSARAAHTSEWPVQHAPAAITSVRQALEAARTMLVQMRRGRPGAAERGERLLVLSESADQLFAHVIVLGEALATIPTDRRRETLHELATKVLARVAATATAIAAGVEDEQQSMPIAVDWNGDSLRAELERDEVATGAAEYQHVAQILDRAAQFATSAARTTEALNSGRPDAQLPRSPTDRAREAGEDSPTLDSLRALLSPGSLIVRFALRVAVVTTLAVAATRALALDHGYWMTLTVIVILQPYTGVTFTRALQRVIGTVLGGLVAAALGAVFHDGRAILVVATVFVACCVALLPLNYAAFSVFLTPTFVLLAEASAGDWHLAGTRVVNTLLGGALALLGSRVLWPSPETRRFPAYGAAALRANAAYLEAVVAGFGDRSTASSTVMRARRRAVGVATANAEESLQRALVEAHGDQSRIAPALSLLAYTRRFTATVAALAIARHFVDESPLNQLRSFQEQATRSLLELARSLDSGSKPHLPPPGAAPAELVGGSLQPRLERLSRHIKTLHDAVSRLGAA